MAIETIEFRVTGEWRDDQGHMLLVGEDGHYSRDALSANEVMPNELDESWLIEPTTSGDAMYVVPVDEDLESL